MKHVAWLTGCLSKLLPICYSVEKNKEKKLKALFSGLTEPQQCLLLLLLVLLRRRTFYKCSSEHSVVPAPLAELNDSCKAMLGPISAALLLKMTNMPVGKRFNEPHAPPFH
ncbi:hypothetical protein T10_356 [Trichinella papuae]|uniref:Uncharacterized protein n=1 Tax=Trichinella papuae TaxID=268474 RepID=A0A0V1MYJ4_9BILA|nr:hypothetical protein T10_356 [Trichinella papuae]